MEIKTLLQFFIVQNKYTRKIFRIMKLSVLFLFVFTLQLMAIGTEAQNTIMRVNSNVVTVAQLINEIEKQTDYLVVFSNREVNTQREVRLQKQSNKVSSFLAEAFGGTDISYEFENNYIILAKKDMVKKAVIAIAQQNDKKIIGTVVDGKGEPIIGANVVVKGTTNGTITDVDGKFTLTNAKKGDILEVSYIGYTSQNIRLSGESSLNVVLKENTQALEEVVVVGYGTQKKVNLTGSVSSVNFQEMASRPVTDASQVLNNASPGLQIMQNSGEPNSENFSYNIRGMGTLNSSSPLVLVDGMEQSISMVNPSDIESVSVLKDAASCAIYGNRGANGVILIKTKSGSDSKVSVSYDGVFSYDQPLKIIHTVSDYVQYMQLMNESSNNLGNPNMFSQSSIDLWNVAKADPNGIAASGYPNYVAYPNIDWWDQIYTNQWMQKHTVSINGKEKKSGYTMSFSYTDNPGVVKKSGYKRYMGRVNLFSDVTDWLRVGSRLWGNVTDRDVSDSSSDFFTGISTVKMLPCTYPFYDGKYGAPEGPEDDPQSHNPLWDMADIDGADKYTQSYSDWYAQVKFLKHFTYNFDFYYKDLRREEKSYDTSIGKYSFSKGAYSTGANAPSTLYTYMYYTRTNDSKLDHLINYNQTFGSHDVSAMAGYEEERYKYRESNMRKLGLTDASVNDLSSATTPYSTSGYGTEYSARSYFGRVNYAYKGKYLFEANIRHDGSSRFAPDYRWGTFPSFSAGWRITEEPWFKSFQWLNSLKLRASWGKLGNNAIGDYDWQSTYSAANYSTGQVITSGIAITSIANRALTWEETAVTNVGFDFGMLNNKLTGNMDVYNKLTTGILYTPDMYMVMGNATGPKENIAEVTNRGVEFEVSWRDRISKDFNYSLKGQFSYNKNFVSKYKGKLERGWNSDNSEYKTNIGDVSTGSGTRIIEDHMINEYYMPNVYKGNGSYFKSDGSVDIKGGPKDGMIRTENDMKWLQAMKAAGYTFQPYNTVAKNALWYGEYIYADANGDGIYGNSYDSEFQGTSSTPKYNFGVQANANWKNFDFSMIWGGAAGFSIYYYVNSRNSSETVYGYTISDDVAKDHYFYDPENPSDPRTNLSSKNPRLVNVSGAQSSALSSLHLEKGDFVKLRNLTIGYTVPSWITKKFYAEKLRVFASGENLFCITGFSGMDPEMRAIGGYSTMSQYAFGVNLTF